MRALSLQKYAENVVNERLNEWRVSKNSRARQMMRIASHLASRSIIIIINLAPFYTTNFLSLFGIARLTEFNYSAILCDRNFYSLFNISFSFAIVGLSVGCVMYFSVCKLSLKLSYIFVRSTIFTRPSRRTGALFYSFNVLNKRRSLRSLLFIFE